MRLPAFMLCENEQADLDGEYVLHTRTPRFLARRLFDDPGQNFKVVDDIDNMLAHFDNDQAKVDALMSSMNEWFRDYQRYLDEQYGEDED